VISWAVGASEEEKPGTDVGGATTDFVGASVGASVGGVGALVGAFVGALVGAGAGLQVDVD